MCVNGSNMMDDYVGFSLVVMYNIYKKKKKVFSMFAQPKIKGENSRFKKVSIEGFHLNVLDLWQLKIKVIL